MTLQSAAISELGSRIAVARSTTDMKTTTRFKGFPALPKELRLIIWEMTFCAPTAAVGRKHAVPNDKTENRLWHLDLFSEGVVQWKIGLSCKEAWRVMESMCSRLTPESGALYTLIGHYWLNLDCTAYIIDKDFNYPFALVHCMRGGRIFKNVNLAWRGE